MQLSKIRILHEDVNIWLVYAGYRRRFFDDFKANNRVFLNLPGFDARQAVFEDEELLRRHLAMSGQIARFNLGATNMPPSRNPQNHDPYPYDPKSKEARSFSADVGNILRLFVEAKIGDLIISPSTGHYSPFLIGEITDNWSKDHDLVVDQLAAEQVPTRKVKWLNVALARRDFPAQASKRMQNRHAITLLDDVYYADVFDTVYSNYVWGDRSKLDLFGDGYRGKDPMEPYEAAKLFKYVMASVFAFEKGEMANFQSMERDESILAYYDESLVIELYQNFNSPGKFTAIVRSGALVALATAGLLVATSSSDGNFDNQREVTKAQVERSIIGPGKGGKTVEMQNYLDSMEPGTWKPLQQELGVPAKESLGLSLDNRVEVATHRAELDIQ